MRFLITLIILFFLPFQAFAGDAMKALINDGPLGGKARKELARKIGESITKIEKATPSLKPNQRKWLAKERDALRDVSTYTHRYLNLLDSTEYAINYVKSHVKVLILALDSIQRGIVPKREEVSSWTFVVYKMNDFMFWQSVQTLVDKEIIEANVLEDHKFPHLDYVSTGNLILSRIVLPYFYENLPD